MAECINCKGYTKYRNGYCPKCYNERNGKLKVTKNESNTGGFPSHTDLYKKIHLVEKDILLAIFNEMGWMYYNIGGIFKKKIVGETEFDLSLEHNGWDWMYFIEKTFEPKLRIPQSSGSKFGNYILGIE